LTSDANAKIRARPIAQDGNRQAGVAREQAGEPGTRRSNLIAHSFQKERNLEMPAMPPMKDLWHHLAPLAGSFHYFFAFIIGAAAVAVRKYAQRIRENRAAMWPSADGQVQTATVKKQQQGCWVEVAYRYYAQQEYRYGTYRRHFARKTAAEAFAEAIRGRNVQVRYRDDKPSESILLEQDLQMTGVLQTG
jgi:uncharacterized protein DUF3592